VSLYDKNKAINLDEVAKMGDKEVDLTKLGYGKVLGGGSLSKPLKIKAHLFSKKAKEKIQKAGGEAIEV
jgi:large subunit ribosomal protein L15